MNKCKECGSYAINLNRDGRDESEQDLCDVCYWRQRAAAAETIIARLQAIVDRLPKTADGVPIVPGDVLHFMDVSMQTVLCWQLPENPRGDEIAVANCCPFSGTYSTREAAEQARAT